MHNDQITENVYKMLTRMPDVTYLFHSAGLCSHACTHKCSLHLSHSNTPHSDPVKNRRPIGAVLKNTHIGFTTFPHSRCSLLPFTSNFYLCVLERFHLNAHHSMDPLCILIAKLKLYLCRYVNIQINLSFSIYST